jgi:hypothetical protein
VSFFYSTYELIKDLQDPPYNANSMARDDWLMKFVKREPNLSGVISTVTAIDKNRGWRMVGGRNQVRKYTEILHDIECAPGLRGWRPGVSHASQSFWTTDIGAILELGRDGKNGPLRALYNVDSTRCHLTGKIDYPLIYHPVSGNNIKFREEDYLRICSMPSMSEKMNGLGYSAVSRCLELAKIMIAVYEHDQEQLGAKAPRGLLLLNGISQTQWQKAMQSRDAELEGKELDYFSSVAVLASNAATVEAKLLSLSSLPISFNLREWMDMVMFGYALCFGYDASEFWPVQFGAMGRGTETEIQHEKATGKGRLDFPLGLQEQLQEQLPESITFTFDQRDEKGDLLHAEVDNAWAKLADTLFANGTGALTRDEVRVLLSDQGVIPKAWAKTLDEISTDQEDFDEGTDDPLADPDPESPSSEEIPEDTTTTPAKTKTPINVNAPITQKKMMREILRSMPHVISACEQFPSEQIVEYSYPENVTTVLWERADTL